MKLTCNIDARGKLARLIWGLMLIGAAVALAVAHLGFAVGPRGPMLLGVGMGLGFGAFAVFEARAGWCVMRAMGFKTPM